jgi:dUTP pyrophosphatase
MCKCNEPIEVKFIKLFDRIKTPEQVDAGSVGSDLRVILDGLEHIQRSLDNEGYISDTYVYIAPQEKITFRTGLKVEIPKGHHMEIHVRSSLGFKKDLALSNTTGIIDSSYRGELFVSLRNIGNETVMISEGERVAQMIVLPYPKVIYKEVTELSETIRGEGGIGSSGKF